MQTTLFPCAGPNQPRKELSKEGLWCIYISIKQLDYVSNSRRNRIVYYMMFGIFCMFIHVAQKENFKVLEDGVPQQVVKFSQAEKPVTVVMLLEFAANHYAFINDMLTNAYTFASTLKRDDWVAVISYDMRPEIQQDFTQDKMKVMGALNHMRIPGFPETNLFDALSDTLDRLHRIESHTHCILLSAPAGTFSSAH